MKARRLVWLWWKKRRVVVGGFKGGEGKRRGKASSLFYIFCFLVAAERGERDVRDLIRIVSEGEIEEMARGHVCVCERCGFFLNLFLFLFVTFVTVGNERENIEWETRGEIKCEWVGDLCGRVI